MLQEDRELLEIFRADTVARLDRVEADVNDLKRSINDQLIVMTHKALEQSEKLVKAQRTVPPAVAILLTLFSSTTSGLVVYLITHWR